MLKITELALNNIKKQLSARNTPNAHMRIGVRGSGCEGFQYLLEWDDNLPKEKDDVFIFDDIKIVIDKKSQVYLQDATLDWEETLMKRGFKFINPQELSRCGCGKSISFK